MISHGLNVLNCWLVILNDGLKILNYKILNYNTENIEYIELQY